MVERFGKIMVVAGICIAVAGLVVWLLGDKLRFLGKLPGDIFIEKENVRIYFPITTMLLLSVVLSFILWLVQKWNK